MGLDLRAFARRVAHALRAAAAQSTFFFAGFAMLFTPFHWNCSHPRAICPRAAREPSQPDCPQKPIGSRVKAIEKFVEANFASAETTFRVAGAPQKRGGVFELARDCRGRVPSIWFGYSL